MVQGQVFLSIVQAHAANGKPPAVRVLRALDPVGPQEEALIDEHMMNDAPTPSIEEESALLTRAQQENDELQHACTREEESRAAARRRITVLQAEVMTLKRKLRAKEHEERKRCAKDLPKSASGDSIFETAQAGLEIRDVDVGVVSSSANAPVNREAVARQSQALSWRCAELRDVKAKVNSARCLLETWTHTARDTI
eukprot:CAMPEP_0183342282 /NCGR_PEP_ID=MMETSP0164_2-20130417/8408_1 /TAXON_ID=221442 /ORGANISM="Coccolithus pelagicus ssp braarudi, Strain PLY182g" /LENGTH=196 /DNA_ID=CAMNT_0025512811 /DNA_START=40 /DNA_END=631 /DNA_ORIENTATION=+